MPEKEELYLAIKNMVCNRCVRVVQEELEKLGLQVEEITLGEATVSFLEEKVPQARIAETLANAGFELLEDKKAKIVEEIKRFIIQLVQQPEHRNKNYSELIAKHIGKDYHSLSQLFSSTENVTIEKYIILQKIERVKELLVYDELSLSQIADELGYSSVAHLSGQFKQVTGFTPSTFKKLKSHNRQSLDEVGNS